MQTLRDGKREVFKFVTPSGVTGIIATEIPREALETLRDKLQRAVERDEGALPNRDRTLPRRPKR